MTKQNKSVNMIHPEWSENSVIYEVNIRQYTREGTFAAFEKHLERLSDMGVDILWLMPVNPIGKTNRKGSLGSYYSVSDYRGINPEFGSFDDFKHLVKQVHDHGMHLIIDWVANHTAWDHPWVKDHPEWYLKDEQGNIKSPFDWTDVVALDYNNTELWKTMAGEMEFWVREADIDGFRCDVAMLVKTEFWEYARLQLDKVKPVFMLAEAEEPEHHKVAFDMSYAWEMHKMFESVIKGTKPAVTIHSQVINDNNNFGTAAYRMQFTTNHDENSWNGTEYEKFGEAAIITAILTFTIPGMPLIYSGQEAANKKRLNFFDKDIISWETLPLHDFYKNLIKLKTSNQALWNGDSGGNYIPLTTSRPQNVIAFIRKRPDNAVIFIGNLSNSNLEIEIDFNEFANTYYDWFTGDEVIFNKTNPFILKPYQYNLYVKH